LSASPQRFQTTGPELEFEIIKEYWNRYKLRDGSRIKARLLLTRIMNDENDPGLYFFEFSNPILVVSCPNDKKGDPNNEPKPEEYNALPSEPIEFEESPVEEWNEYKIAESGKILKVKYTVSGIKRVPNRFNHDGRPFYLVTGAPAVTAV
jgi:hypothetical protein